MVGLAIKIAYALIAAAYMPSVSSVGKYGIGGPTYLKIAMSILRSSTFAMRRYTLMTNGTNAAAGLHWASLSSCIRQSTEKRSGKNPITPIANQVKVIH